MKKLIMLPCSLILISGILSAQSVLPIKKVSIFKSGTTMVTKEGPLKAKDNLITLPVPSQALYGTFWVGVSEESTLKGLVVQSDTIRKMAKANTLEELLMGNTGKHVTVNCGSGLKEDRIIMGKIAGFMPEANLLKLKGDNGKFVFLRTTDIEQIDFDDDNSSTYMKDTIVRLANVRVDKANENVSLLEHYMQLGINWIPSYYLRLTNDKEARLEMKATIENYAEDLEDVETEVVVGSPQLYFNLQLDPITYDYVTSASTTSASRYSYLDNSNISNVMQTQQMAGNGRGNVAYEADYTTTTFETEGEKNNDLYYYNLGKITLPKNSKGLFPIFSSNVNYKDKYEANIPDRINFASTLYCDDTEGIVEVFHSVEIKNTTTFPFTTAAVMVITDKNQFMAQDRIKYTPAGAITTVKLSKAIDILAKNAEEEIARVENVKKIGKISYSKVTLKGTITVENMQTKAVVIDVIKTTNGNVTDGGNGKIKKQKTYNSVNPYTEIKWELPLAAGEKKTLTYQYEVLFTPYYSY